MYDDDEIQAAKKALAKNACAYCGMAISAHQVIHPGHCGAQNCVASHAVSGFDQREHQRKQDYAARQENVQAKAGAQLATAAKVLDQNVDDVLIAVVPFQNASLVPMPETRRTAFEAHVEDIVENAFAAGPDDISMLNYLPGTAAEPSIIAAGCAACQGFCCQRGGGDKHAFLTRQTIYHMRDNDPDLEPEAVIQHYLDALPETSVQGSCVYHGAQGCTLQRKWRSSVCNVFHCHDIHALHELTGGRSDVPLAIIGVEEDAPGKVIAFDAALGMTEINPT